jgi:uncharacterized hydrophobic protein (TIGR00271 family)
MLWGLLRTVDPSVRHEVLGSLFFTGARLRPYLFRFFILLGLSVIIASFGILSNSTAVVIGGMLVAPLMTPVLGLAAATVMAWPRRLGETALLVAIASLGAVALAWFVASFMPEGVYALVLPGELISRTEPTMQDLGIAVAAGAAGAYVLVHKESVSALPGVAVAVALVPPLAVVGISLALGNYDDAGGALLLYLTNLAGIVLAAMVVFVLTGFVPEFQAERGRKNIWLGFGVAAMFVLLVSVPLIGNSYIVVDDARDESAVRAEIEEWLGDESSLDVVALVVSGNDVTLNLFGPNPPPPAADLRTELTDDLGSDVSVEVDWIKGVEDSAGPPVE